MIRLDDFDTYYPEWAIRIPDDIKNKEEFTNYTSSSFEQNFMYNFEKVKSDFAMKNYKYVTEEL